MIPASATAHLNIRIHHGDTVDGVSKLSNKLETRGPSESSKPRKFFTCIPLYHLQIIQHLRSCISDDRVHIKILQERPESPIASRDGESFGYNIIASSIKDVFPDVIVAPGLCQKT